VVVLRAPPPAAFVVQSKRHVQNKKRPVISTSLQYYFEQTS